MINSFPLVSVLIITYNHENYIRQCIESVLMQVCNFSLELVIGEDCSTDSTRNICVDFAQKYSNIKLLQSDSNIGMINNFLKTSKACKGKYIAMLEGDDYWTDPHKLQKQVNFLEQNSDFSLCYHNKRHLNIDGTVSKLIYNYNQDEYFTGEEVFKAHIHTLTVVFRNILLEHPLPTYFEQLPLYDFALWAYLSLHGKCAYLNFDAANYRIHSSSIYSTNVPVRNFQKMIDCFNIIRKYFPENYQNNFNYYTLVLNYMITEELRNEKSYKYYYYLFLLFFRSFLFKNREFYFFYRSHYKTELKNFIKSQFKFGYNYNGTK